MSDDKLSAERIDKLAETNGIFSDERGLMSVAIRQLRDRCQALEEANDRLSNRVDDQYSKLGEWIDKTACSCPTAAEKLLTYLQGHCDRLQAKLAEAEGERDELQEHVAWLRNENDLEDTIRQSEADIKAGRVHDIEDVIQDKSTRTQVAPATRLRREGRDDD